MRSAELDTLAGAHPTPLCAMTRPLCVEEWRGRLGDGCRNNTTFLLVLVSCKPAQQLATSRLQVKPEALRSCSGGVPHQTGLYFEACCDLHKEEASPP
jgi:hypothetical protein